MPVRRLPWRRHTGARMPGYQVREIEQPIGGQRYRLRLLSDTQQFADPDGHGARAGKSILQLGRGTGRASMVLRRRGADVAASDVPPLAEVFLAYNAALNDLPAAPFRHIDWDLETPNLGMFDVIIASDVLYERG